MVKTVITPKNKKYSLTIPTKYIGKKIEVLLYALDEVSEEKQDNTKKTMADFSGIFNEHEYQLLKTHTEKARKEWSRDI
jgi:hypothetical protein